MFPSLAGKTQYKVKPMTNGGLCRALKLGRIGFAALATMPCWATQAHSGEPVFPVNPQAATSPSPLQSMTYSQAAAPAMLPGVMAQPPLPNLPNGPEPFLAAPQPLVNGPVAVAETCGSTGRTDFFPFEFSRYTARFDTIWFRRDTSGDQFIANAVVNATGQAFALDTESSLDITSYNPGARVFFEEAVGDCTSFVNGSFMWFQKMNTGTTLDNAQGVTITRGAGGFGLDFTLRQDTIFDCTLYSADFSYREDFGTFSLSFGPRFLHLEENYQIFERGVFTDPFRGQILTDATRQTFTYNDMIGLQIGYDYNYEATRFISIASFLRGAVMINYSGYRIDQGVGDSVAGPLVRTVRNNTANLAGVFEVGMIASVRLTRHATLRGGYQLLYTPGIASAPDQFIPDLFGQDSSDVDRKGTGLFHGPFLGLEIKWGVCE